eukprot:scaffold49_cov409-Prasinococcus_capsulatus_cf.AAC.36
MLDHISTEIDGRTMSVTYTHGGPRRSCRTGQERAREVPTAPCCVPRAAPAESTMSQLQPWNHPHSLECVVGSCKSAAAC